MTYRTDKNGKPIRPHCFPLDVWAEWMAMREVVNTKVGPCRDCLPAYKAVMLTSGLCDYPQVVFKPYSDGGVYGAFPEERHKENDESLDG
jgi:hypothetical protein